MTLTRVFKTTSPKWLLISNKKAHFSYFEKPPWRSAILLCSPDVMYCWKRTLALQSWQELTLYLQSLYFLFHFRIRGITVSLERKPLFPTINRKPFACATMLRSFDLVCYNMRYNPGFLKRCHQIDCFSNVKPTFQVGRIPDNRLFHFFLQLDVKTPHVLPLRLVQLDVLR